MSHLSDKTAVVTESSQGIGAGIGNTSPLGRFGTVEEMARCAEFLTSTNNYVTGEVLYADGGWQAYARGAGDQ